MLSEMKVQTIAKHKHVVQRKEEAQLSDLGIEDLSLSLWLVVYLFTLGRKSVGAWKPACEITLVESLGSDFQIQSRSV